MLSSIKVHINSNNQGILNAVKNVIPAENDPIVALNGLNIQEGDLLGVNYFMADIQFNEKLDRDAVLQTIKGLNGIINACLSGSKVIGYTHKHAEGLSCEQETILEKV